MRKKIFIIFTILIFYQIVNAYRLPEYLFEDNLSKYHIDETEKIKLTIIIDDIGNSFEKAQQIWAINRNITLSILPFLKYSQKISIYAKKHHLPVMLHFPMEPLNYKNKLENFFLLANMDDKKFFKVMNAVLNSIPYYQGINNHMGSKFTSDKSSLEKFFDIIKFKKVFFIDSRTTPFSKAAKISLENGILTGVRDVFLDNKLDVNYILHQLEKLYKIAQRKRYAIAIGHHNKEKIEALKIFFNRTKNVKILTADKGLKFYKNYEKALVLKKVSH